MCDTLVYPFTTFIKVDIAKVNSLGGEVVKSKTVEGIRTYKEFVVLRFKTPVSETEVKTTLHLPNGKVEKWHSEDNKDWEFVYSNPYLSLSY